MIDPNSPPLKCEQNLVTLFKWIEGCNSDSVCLPWVSHKRHWIFFLDLSLRKSFAVVPWGMPAAMSWGHASSLMEKPMWQWNEAFSQQIVPICHPVSTSHLDMNCPAIQVITTLTDTLTVASCETPRQTFSAKLLSGFLTHRNCET